MAADGSVAIEVKLDAAGVDSGIAKLKSKIQGLGTEAEKAGSRGSSSLKAVPGEVSGASSAFDKLKAHVQAAGDKVSAPQPAAAKLASGIGSAAVDT